MWKKYRGIIIGLVISLAIAVFISPLASPNPDGLERAAMDNEIGTTTDKPLLQALVPDYMMPWIENEKVATGAAGAVGTIITFGTFYIIGKLISKTSTK